MTHDSEHAAFERAFVATSYLLDRRGEDLLVGLDSPLAHTREIVRALGHPERQARAVVLAREIALIVSALEERRIV